MTIKKMVIKVQMNCERCKIKVMEIAATTPGVKSVEVMGEISDGKITVTGEMDSVSLTRNVRKKLGSANIESLEDVKEEKKATEEKKEEIGPTMEYTPFVNGFNFYPPYNYFHRQFY